MIQEMGFTRPRAIVADRPRFALRAWIDKFGVDLRLVATLVKPASVKECLFSYGVAAIGANNNLMKYRYPFR